MASGSTSEARRPAAGGFAAYVHDEDLADTWSYEILSRSRSRSSRSHSRQCTSPSDIEIPTGKRRKSAFMVATDAVASKMGFKRRPATPNQILVDSASMMEQEPFVLHRDDEGAERERLRERAAFSIGVGQEIPPSVEFLAEKKNIFDLMEEQHVATPATMGRSARSASVSSPFLPGANNLISRIRRGSVSLTRSNSAAAFTSKPLVVTPSGPPPFPASLSSLQPCTRLSALVPKYCPSNSKIPLAPNKKWRHRYTVLSSVPPHLRQGRTNPSYIHAYKSSHPNEVEIERLEINGSSDVSSLDDEIHGSQGIIQVDGTHLGKPETWFLQMEDSLQAQMWIKTIKNVILSQQQRQAVISASLSDDSDYSESKGLDDQSDTPVWEGHKKMGQLQDLTQTRPLKSGGPVGVLKNMLMASTIGRSKSAASSHSQRFGRSSDASTPRPSVSRRNSGSTHLPKVVTPVPLRLASPLSMRSATNFIVTQSTVPAGLKPSSDRTAQGRPTRSFSLSSGLVHPLQRKWTEAVPKTPDHLAGPDIFTKNFIAHSDSQNHTFEPPLRPTTEGFKKSFEQMQTFGQGGISPYADQSLVRVMSSTESSQHQAGVNLTSYDIRRRTLPNPIHGVSPLSGPPSPTAMPDEETDDNEEEIILFGSRNRPLVVKPSGDSISPGVLRTTRPLLRTHRKSYSFGHHVPYWNSPVAAVPYSPVAKPTLECFNPSSPNIPTSGHPPLSTLSNAQRSASQPHLDGRITDLRTDPTFQDLVAPLSKVSSRPDSPMLITQQIISLPPPPRRAARSALVFTPQIETTAFEQMVKVVL